MSISILTDPEHGYQALYCDTTMWAFGGIFYEEEDPAEFLEWLEDDPRFLGDSYLESKITDWRFIKSNEKP